ncbi:MAG: hypothetical protein H7836_15800, partial [Magnetococcus sp. YQC-3]
VALSKSSLSAEKYVSDLEIIDKHKWIARLLANGQELRLEYCYHFPIYPNKPVFQDSIYFVCYQDSGGSLNFYYRVIYSIAYLSRDEMMSMLKNAIL